MHLTLHREGRGWRFTARYHGRERSGWQPSKRQALNNRYLAVLELLGS